MSGNNSAPKDEWVRLNVGGKVFQTTKDTLSRYPDTFLARLVNGGLSSDKDESGAYLIDADPEHFGTILNYFRRGSVKLDGSKMNLEDLLREADFFNIEPLVIEIRQAMSAPDQMTAILTKLDDMSKKLSSVGTNPMMLGMGQHMSVPTHMQPRCQNCNKTVSCCNDPKPQKPPPAKMIMQGPMPSSTAHMGFTQIAPMPPKGSMVCQNCNKTTNCCHNPQPKMFDPNKPSFCAARQHQDAKPPGFICTGRYDCNH